MALHVRYSMPVELAVAVVLATVQWWFGDLRLSNPLVELTVRPTSMMQFIARRSLRALQLSLGLQLRAARVQLWDRSCRSAQQAKDTSRSEEGVLRAHRVGNCPRTRTETATTWSTPHHRLVCHGNDGPADVCIRVCEFCVRRIAATETLRLTTVARAEATRVVAHYANLFAAGKVQV